MERISVALESYKKRRRAQAEKEDTRHGKTGRRGGERERKKKKKEREVQIAKVGQDDEG